MSDLRFSGSSLPRTSFSRGLRTQCKVVGALIMRELHTRYGRENIGYLWLILEPMLLCVMIALLHSRSPTHYGADMKAVPFALVSYCPFIVFRSIFTRADGALESNLPLLYHRNVTIFDVMLSRALLELASAFFAFLFLMGLAVAAGMANPPYRPLLVLCGFGLMFLLSFGLSMIVCAVTHENKAVGRLVHPVGYILLPLSAVFTVMDWLPKGYQAIFAWVPMAHIAEFTRYGQFRSASSDFFDLYYVGGWILGTTLVGLLAISAMRGKIHMP